MISFTVYGNLQSGKNRRRPIINPRTKKRQWILSEKAEQYKHQFIAQVPASARQGLEVPVHLHAKIYYQSHRSDLCDSLLSDCLQWAGVIKDDRQIRYKTLDGTEIDRKNPRVEVTVTVLEAKPDE